ncbi:MAG: bifunctional oligoribonuclease/PAP phosphatase NrnA [Candidatus Marinimicrobia bacterium]|nr:bifunctional oligoribonuclease/PAP phosphatase NrnA [Candidatus Neomarinimicrobiota bacterium]
MDQQYFREKRDWESLKKILNDNNSFVFSTHLEPDADGIGSELGLARYLESKGKSVQILNPSKMRVNLEFLTERDEIQVFDPALHKDIISSVDVFIAFDIGHYSRLSDIGPAFGESSAIKISIDHHPGDKTQFDYRYDFPSASSTGVLIYDLLSELEAASPNDFRIAKPLYAAIMSDTGNFRFNNTDPETFFAAGNLVAAGVKPYELYVSIYEDLNTPGRLQVLQHLLRELNYDCDGRLAWSLIDYEELQSLGATPDDLHSLSDFIRSIKGVEIGVSLIKMSNQPTDVSFRSKGHIPINTVAYHFNGGGHAFAAGCRIDDSLENAGKAVVEECRQAIKDWDANV